MLYRNISRGNKLNPCSQPVDRLPSAKNQYQQVMSAECMSGQKNFAKDMARSAFRFFVLYFSKLLASLRHHSVVHKLASNHPEFPQEFSEIFCINQVIFSL